MKIAITGANGFLGQAVISKLKGEKIDHVIFNREKHNLFKPKTLRNFLLGCDAIIHLAAINRGDNLELVKTNITGTQSLLEAMQLFAPSSKIVFASSFQVYLNSGLYGLSKKFAEDLIKEYSKKTSLQGTVLRISNIYGPGGTPFYNSVIATFAHLIKKGEPVKINGDGSSRRDYIFVSDVADAIVKATHAKKLKNFETIDICSGKETTLKQILQIIEKVSGKKLTVMYNEAAKEKPWPTAGKNYKKAYQLLGWKPSTTIAEGLKKVMQYHED